MMGDTFLTIAILFFVCHVLVNGKRFLVNGLPLGSIALCQDGKGNLDVLLFARCWQQQRIYCCTFIAAAAAALVSRYSRINDVFFNFFLFAAFIMRIPARTSFWCVRV